MKISKLFHWLYAVLMFLPLVMFLPSCLYYSLNKYATNETTTEINYKYQSNEVNTLDDLIEGNLYHFSITNNTMDSYITNDNSLAISFNFVNIIAYDFANYALNFEISEIITNSYENKGFISVALSIDADYNTTLNFYLTTNETNDYFLSLYVGELVENFTLIGDFIYLGDTPNFYDISFITISDFNVIESVETNVQDTISNKLYNAWESIWNLPLFAWTKNSFVSAPFTYITGLFGLSSTNSLNYVFTYFCSISICWLVFDLLMYVPNLAHRWLDKGAIE